MIIVIITKALFIGIIIGALLYWFSARQQGKLVSADGVGSGDVDTKRSPSVFFVFIKNLLILILVLMLSLLILRIVL